MSPRNEEQNMQIKDERREQILSAALKVFAKKGFAASKISDIVAAAGVSHGLFYHYFKSKEDVFYELLKLAITSSTQAILMVNNMPISPLEKVRQTAKYILGGIESFEDSAYYFLIVIHAFVMDAPAEIKALTENPNLQIFSKIVRDGQQTGEIREGDPDGMTMTFFAAIQGLAMYKLALQNFKMPDPEILVSMLRKA
ncbi:TetR/AcrR family transcriptional regulator [Oscillospiraceae bacterium CM]|nr:TetR/AcrR family transcriptional regulator [Oscillospiraceae bacterium CM]